MSARQRLVPLFLATGVGVVSGYYIFDPLLKQYAVDSRGTYDPKVAQAGLSGGIGGGVNEVNKIASQASEAAQSSTPASNQAPAAETTKLYGQEARDKLNEVLQATKSSKGDTKA